jgi:outer membrane protein OmpA-like peptidoglycan-associated protein
MKPVLILLLLLQTVCGRAQEPDSLSLYFDFNKAALSPGARQTTDSFIARYRAQGTGSISVLGYCDNVGGDPYNDRLSESRVASVQDYLRSHGINGNLLSPGVGYGRRRPVNANTTPQERATNRRVTIGWMRTTDSARERVTPPIGPTLLEPHTVLPREALDSAREGQTIRLRNINFYGGRHTFLPQVRPVLEDLLATMKANPTLAIEIQGHICCVFSGEDQADFDAGDRNLSRNRAKAVYDYLVAGGVDGSRLRYRGFAGSRPLIRPERNEVDRTLNRRVEILILRK